MKGRFFVAGILAAASTPWYKKQNERDFRIGRKSYQGTHVT